MKRLPSVLPKKVPNRHGPRIKGIYQGVPLTVQVLRYDAGGAHSDTRRSD